MNIYVTIGIRIPNVPHDVPVANESPHATRKIIAGRNLSRPPAALLITSATKYLAPSAAVIFLRDVAKVRINIAGTIAIKPLGTAVMASLKLISLLSIRNAIIATREMSPPHGKPKVASVFANASIKFTPSSIPPTYTSANTQQTIRRMIGKIRSMTLPFSENVSSSDSFLSPLV